MTRLNLAGAALCGLILGAAFLTGEGAHHYFNLTGLLIVVAGTFGATLLSFPSKVLGSSIRVAWNVYRVEAVTPARVVEALMELALLSRQDGMLSLQNHEGRTEVTYLKTALEMLVDGYSESEMRDLLHTESTFFLRRREELERVFRHMAQLAPSFGVAGSVVGLIGLLTGLGDLAVILESIPLALTSTLYGVLLGSFVFHPIAESIHSKTEQEMFLQRLIVEGVVAVQRESNPSRLERKLLSFLTPAARPRNQQSFDQIRRKYRKLQMQRDESGMPLHVHGASGSPKGSSTATRRDPKPARRYPAAPGTSPNR